jgi:hypothetical protein
MAFINTRYRMLNYSNKTKPNGLVRQLVTGLPSQRPGFDPRSCNMWLLVDKVALGQVFSEYFGFPCHSFHPVLSTSLSFGLGQRGPTSGWRTKWTESHPTNWKKPKYGDGFRGSFSSSSALFLDSLHWKCVEVWYFDFSLICHRTDVW